MKTTTELLQELNTMQSEHIKILNGRIVEQVKRYDNSLQPLEAQHEELIKKIEVISEHRQHLNETISNQARQLEELIRMVRIDEEVISDFKKIINQQQLK